MGGRTADSSEMIAAHLIVDHLENGQDVPARSLDFARQAMMRQMGKEGARDARGTLASDLRGLMNHDPSVEHRGQVLGSVLALGSQADGALEALLDTSRGDLFGGLFSALERIDLVTLAGRSMRERLAHVAQWLEDSGANPEANSLDQNKKAPSKPVPQPARPVADRPRSTNPLDEQEIDHEQASAPPPPDEQLEADLRNTSASEETRVSAALRLGPPALPILEAMVADPAQREVALSALVLLGGDGAHARIVRDAAINLEVHHDPETKATGRMLRDTLDGVPPAPPDEGKDLPTAAGGWLHRSLELCSAPAILMASAGRESLAIPLTMRRLVEVRRARAAE